MSILYNRVVQKLKFLNNSNVEIPELFEARKTIEVELAGRTVLYATCKEIGMMKECLDRAEDNIDSNFLKTKLNKTIIGGRQI
jgi:DNA-binding FadR family transcriptional regulator